MYKILVPNLVSVELNTGKITESNFLQNFNFFQETARKKKLHYAYSINNKLQLPQNYDFKSEYFFKKDNCWYYEKKIFGQTLKFKYDIANKLFQCTKLLANIPFRIGGILPAVEYLQGLINLDLFLEGYVIYRGIAFQYKEKTYCIIAPGLNGKTTFLTSIIEKGGKYIAEDNLLIDLKNMEVYPTANSKMAKIFNRKTNKILEKELNKNNIITTKQKIDELLLTQNSTTYKYKTNQKNIFEFLMLNSLYFLDSNLFIKSFLFEEGLTDKFIKKLNDIKKITNYKFIHLKNYKLENLVK